MSTGAEFDPCSALALDYPNDATVYLVEEDFGRLGRAYLERDTGEADPRDDHPEFHLPAV
jgi:hypothetical protein